MHSLLICRNVLTDKKFTLREYLLAILYAYKHLSDTDHIHYNSAAIETVLNGYVVCFITYNSGNCAPQGLVACEQAVSSVAQSLEL